MKFGEKIINKININFFLRKVYIMPTTNCRLAMTEYLLNNNVLYRVRWPLAILIAICGSTLVNKQLKLKGFLAHVVVPLSLLLLPVIVIESLTKSQLNMEEVEKLTLRCTNWQNDPKVHKNNKNRCPKTGQPYIIATLAVNYEDDTQKKDLQKMHHEQYIKQMAMEQMANPNDFEEDDAEPQHASRQELQEQTEQAQMENYEGYVEGMAVRAYSQDSDDPENQFAGVQAVNQQNVAHGCLLGKDNCSPLCSGIGGNPCNLVAPSPGPMWQPQTAATVQSRLNSGNYVPSTCNVCSAPNASY